MIAQIEGVSLLAARRPAVIFANAYGDNIMTLMALRALGALFPARLAFIGETNVQRRFFADVDFGAVHEVDFSLVATDPSGGQGRSFDVRRVAEQIAGCDLFLSLNPWSSASLQALRQALLPAPSVGFLRGFDVNLPVDASRHSVQLAFDLPTHLEPRLRLESFSAPLRLSEAARRPALRLLSRLRPGTRILAVHADTKANKMWPAERFLALLDRFLAAHPDFLALIVGSVDIGLASLSSARPVISCLGLPLDVTMAMVGAADLFLGVDSCMLHAADVFRVPGVGLFGPTSSHEFGFVFARHRHVDARGAMESLSAAQVSEALESLLTEIAERDQTGLPSAS